MRASVILAALAASPFVAGRACRHRGGHHGGDHHDEEAVESPSEVASDPTPTAVVDDVDNNYVDNPEPEVTPSSVHVDEDDEEDVDETPAPETPAPETTSVSSGSGSTDPLNMGTFESKATYYGGGLADGTCSFTTYSLPAGMHGVALPIGTWDPTNCGACIEITGPKGNKITAMVVDQCPTCTDDHIDLYPDAFAELDDPVIGIIQTSYEFVSCGISSPMKLHNKDSASAYWLAMQVVNHNVPIESLEVSTDGGSTWSSTSRSFYNFFEIDGGTHTESVDVKLKSTTGEEMLIKGVDVNSEVETDCPGNF